MDPESDPEGASISVLPSIECQTWRPVVKLEPLALPAQLPNSLPFYAMPDFRRSRNQRCCIDSHCTIHEEDYENLLTDIWMNEIYLTEYAHHAPYIKTLAQRWLENLPYHFPVAKVREALNNYEITKYQSTKIALDANDKPIGGWTCFEQETFFSVGLISTTSWSVEGKCDIYCDGPCGSPYNINFIPAERSYNGIDHITLTDAGEHQTGFPTWITNAPWADPWVFMVRNACVELL